MESVSGRFAQISGFAMDVDLSGTAQEVDDNGNVLTAGSRIVNVTLNNGTAIVANGEVATGTPEINIATIDFLARGGDQYPYGETGFTALGVTYQQALANYLVESLNGVIAEADYPAGGTGRIEFIGTGTPLNPDAGNALTFDNQNVTGLYPNPFSNELNFTFAVPVEGQATIFLSNTQGQVMKVLHRGIHAAGNYQFTATDVADVPSGMYFLTIQTAAGNATELVTKR